MKKLKKVWRRHEKKNEEWEIKELCIYVCKKQVLEFVQRLSDSSDSLISSRLDDIFFSSRSKNEKLFLCWIFLFFLKFVHSRHGTALLSMMMMTFVHMYSSHWGTSVSKHISFHSRNNEKKEKFLHMGIV